MTTQTPKEPESFLRRIPGIDEHIKRVVDGAPPLTEAQILRLAQALAPAEPSRHWGPQDAKPVHERNGTPLRTRIDPKAGDPYRRTLVANNGHCQRCGRWGGRWVDHCHQHDRVRGLICHACNSVREGNMGWWRYRCPECGNH